jgi:HEAT repeat protein
MRIRTWILIFLGALALAGCSQGPATDELIEDLSSAEEIDRVKAVRWLNQGHREAATVIPALIEALKDPEVDVRRGAAIGLGNFGEEAESALPALEAVLQDKDARVRNAAKVAISRIRGEE